jgi:hypothetical protein
MTGRKSPAIVYECIIPIQANIDKKCGAFSSNYQQKKQKCS